MNFHIPLPRLLIATTLPYLFYLFIPSTPSSSNKKGGKKIFAKRFVCEGWRVPEYGPRISLQNDIFGTHFDRIILK